MSRDLWRAIGEKKHKIATELMKNGNLDVDMTFAHAWTCLRAACERGYVDIAQKLLDMGCTADIIDWSGESALHSAAEHGHVDITRLLLSAKVVQTPNNNGRLPSHLAARKGHYEVLKLLLQRFPETVNVKDQEGRTPLHEAAANGHLGVVKMLVTCGGKPDVMTNVGETPGKLAILYGHTNVAKYLE